MLKLETTRILKKLDGFSVLLALVLSSGFQNFQSLTYELSAIFVDKLSTASDFSEGYFSPDMHWGDRILIPVFNALFWLVAVELVLQVAKYLRQQSKTKSKK